MKELESCELCEWRCKVNRLKGEKGVCRVGVPRVVLSTLHPAPPASFDAFMSGCNFRCLGCQNYTLSMLHEKGEYIPPEEWAELGLAALESWEARRMGADRLFFTGGEPTCSLPWIEKVVEYARNKAKTKVNFDTNGFMTPNSLERVLSFSDSVTFDIKAFSDEVHRLLTGAPVKPALQNVEYTVENALEKVYEFRVIIYPGFLEEAVKIAHFLAELSEDCPLCYLAFRPNFVLDEARGITVKELNEVVEAARDYGLKRVDWAGLPGIPGSKEGKDFRELAEKAGCTKVKEEVRVKTNAKSEKTARTKSKSKTIITAEKGRLCTCKECALMGYKPKRRT